MIYSSSYVMQCSDILLDVSTVFLPWWPEFIKIACVSQCATKLVESQVEAKLRKTHAHFQPSIAFSITMKSSFDIVSQKWPWSSYSKGIIDWCLMPHAILLIINTEQENTKNIQNGIKRIFHSCHNFLFSRSNVLRMLSPSLVFFCICLNCSVGEPLKTQCTFKRVLLLYIWATCLFSIRCSLVLYMSCKKWLIIFHKQLNTTQFAKKACSSH